MEKTGFIWMNGEMKKWDDAKVHVLSHALHYGSGVFEGIRFYKTPQGPAVFRLQDHIKRFFYSFGVFKKDGLPYTQQQIEAAVVELVKTNKVDEGYIRPLMFFGYGELGLYNYKKCEVNVAIALWPWARYLGSHAVSLKVSKYIRLHPQSVVSDAKICGYYVNSILASIDAKENGFDEALLLDYEGNIAEGPGENLFIIKDGALRTPAPLSLLPGITRNTVMTLCKDMKINVSEAKLKLDELCKADEAFYVGTAAEITPIGKVNGKPVGSGEPGPLTTKISKLYQEIIHGENDKYKGWLTHA